MPEFVHRLNAQDEYVIVNVYEEIVRDAVVKMMGYMEMCSCDKCVSDACALVLNEIKPMYVTTKKGGLLSKVGESAVSRQVDLTVHVVSALQLVRESPRH
jgi:competence protein ComFB